MPALSDLLQQCRPLAKRAEDLTGRWAGPDGKPLQDRLFQVHGELLAKVLAGPSDLEDLIQVLEDDRRVAVRSRRPGATGASRAAGGTILRRFAAVKVDLPRLLSALAGPHPGLQARLRDPPRLAIRLLVLEDPGVSVAIDEHADWLDRVVVTACDAEQLVDLLVEIPSGWLSPPEPLFREMEVFWQQRPLPTSGEMFSFARAAILRGLPPRAAPQWLALLRQNLPLLPAGLADRSRWQARLEQHLELAGYARSWIAGAEDAQVVCAALGRLDSGIPTAGGRGKEIRRQLPALFAVTAGLINDRAGFVRLCEALPAIARAVLPDAGSDAAAAALTLDDVAALARDAAAGSDAGPGADSGAGSLAQFLSLFDRSAGGSAGTVSTQKADAGASLPDSGARETGPAPGASHAGPESVAASVKLSLTLDEPRRIPADLASRWTEMIEAAGKYDAPYLVFLGELIALLDGDSVPRFTKRSYTSVDMFGGRDQDWTLAAKHIRIHRTIRQAINDSWQSVEVEANDLQIKGLPKGAFIDWDGDIEAGMEIAVGGLTPDQATRLAALARRLFKASAAVGSAGSSYDAVRANLKRDNRSTTPPGRLGLHDELELRALSDEDPDVGLGALARFNWQAAHDRPEVMQAVLDALQRGHPAVQAAVAEQLGAEGDSGSVPALMGALGCGGSTVREKAAAALARLGDRAAIPALLGCFGDRSPSVRRQAVDSVGRLARGSTDPDLLARIAALLKDDDQYVRDTAAWVLIDFPAPVLVEPLLAALQDPYYPVRHGAVLALAKHDDPRVLPALNRMLQDENERVRVAAASCLE